MFSAKDVFKKKDPASRKWSGAGAMQGLERGAALTEGGPQAETGDAMVKGAKLGAAMRKGRELRATKAVKVKSKRI